MAINTITYQGFNGGISQDDYRTGRNQVLFSEGLDMNSDSYSVSLEYGLTSLVETNNRNMNTWFYVEDTGGNRTACAAGEGGEVYKTDSTDNTPEYTFSDSRNVNSTLNMGGFVYFVSGSSGSQIKVGKMAQTDTTITAVTENITTSGDTLPNGTLRSTYPLYNFNDEILFIGVGTTLVSLDKNDNVTNYDLFEDAIVSIQKAGPLFKIYSSGGQVSYWKFGDAGISESFRVNDFIRGALNRGSVDFMVSGFNSTQTNLHLSSGYSAPILANKQDSDRLDEPKFRTVMERPSQLARIGDLVFFVCEDDTNNQRLWSYGNKKRVLGDSFSNIVGTHATNGRIKSLFGFQGPSADTVYVGGIENGVEKIFSYTLGTNQQTSGYMILNTLDGGDRTRKKKMIALYAMVSGCSALNTITISASFDQAAYQDLKAITTEGNSQIIEVKTSTKQWNDVNFKITLTDGGTGTPKFHGLRVVYDVIDD